MTARSAPGIVHGVGRAARRLAVRIAIAGAAIAVPLCGAAQEGGEEPFLVFDRSHPLLPDDGVPMVQVFESGRVVVTRGPGRTRPGRYEYALDAAAFARLRSLAVSGASASLPAVAVPRRELVDGREVFTVVHDAVTTSLRVTLSGTDGGQSLGGAPATVRVIEVEGLADVSADAVGSASLIELERALLDVFARPVDGERGR